MTMLAGVWALRDVSDVEALCRGVLGESLRRASVELEPADFDESLAFLLGQTVELERKFDGRPGIKFRPWLYNELRRDLIDYWRSWYGRSGQKRVPEDDPNAPVGGDHTGIDPPDPHDDPGDSRLERSARSVTDNCIEDRADALLRFLDQRGGGVLRPFAGLHQGAAEGVAQRHPRSGGRGARVKEVA
jgi:hypothetical protein